MKKFLSCVLALALVFSLMSMTVFAGDELHPNLQDPSSNAVTGDTHYQVVGTQGDRENDKATSYQDGKTDFNETGVKADVGVTFEKTTTTTDPNNPNQTVTNTVNVLEHRYAIDIVYKELVFDLTKLTPTEEIPDPENPGETVERTYKFVWDVTQHTYVMVEVIDGKAVGGAINPNDPANEDLTDAEITIEGAFQVINHSDLSVNYSAAISVSQEYGNVLNMNVVDAEGNKAPRFGATNIPACTAKMTASNDGTPPTWEAGTEQKGVAHTIIATPVDNWATTISALAADATAQVTVGFITITVTK